MDFCGFSLRRAVLGRTQGKAYNIFRTNTAFLCGNAGRYGCGHQTPALSLWVACRSVVLCGCQKFQYGSFQIPVKTQVNHFFWILPLAHNINLSPVIGYPELLGD